MSNTVKLKAGKRNRRAGDSSIRVVRVRSTDRSWLLAGTALFAGVMAGGLVGASPAFAETLGVACNINPANYYTCAGPETAPLVLEPNGTFQVDLGPNADLNPLDLDVNNAAPALTIEADGYSTENDGIRLYNNSSINNAGGTGVAILNPGSPGAPVVFQIDGNGGNVDFTSASVIGTTGIFVENDGGFGPGHIVIRNDGHVEGTAGAAIEATGGSEDGLIFELQNHSYQSSIGAVDGVYVHDDIIWTEISNGNGLIAGLGNHGVNIYNVDNSVAGRNAVQINNNSAGVIAGYNTGVYIYDVNGIGAGNGNVQINNGAYYDNPSDAEPQRGGLIAGVNEDGVYVSDIGGDLRINNGGTLGDSFNLGVLDTRVSNNEDGLLDTGYLFGGIDASLGIWGQQRGVNVYDVGRTVSINNGSYTDDAGNLIEDGGLIVGVNDDAVHISGVEGVYGEDGGGSWYQAVDLNNRDGLMWGGDDGAYIRDADGNVNVNNQWGTIFGIEDGLQVDDTWRGGVFVGNAGGRIQGFYGDGIKMDDVDSWGEYGGWVDIANGDFDGNPNPLSEDGFNPNWGMDGGLIWGADNAIDIEDADRVWIGNGVGGVIVGDGDWRQPVIKLETSNDEGEGANVINLGLMTSDNIPYFERDWTAPDAIDVPALPLDAEAVASLLQDYDDIGSFVWNGGQVGLVDNLSSYAEAASDMLMWNRGGATYVENHGVMVGRVNLDGHNGDDWPDVRGNTIKNFGTWLVTDNGEWGTELRGSSNDEIQNAGLIQTAFGSDTYETANFGGVNRFLNGGSYDDGFHAESALLSMTDGGTGDFTWIDGEFRGGDDGSLTSFVGMDVNFGPAAGLVDEEDPSTWRADFLQIEDEIRGSTGLIINKVGSDGTDLLGDKIYVAYAPWDGNDDDMMCFEEACVEGDTMYIDGASEGYIDVAGVGAIQDGFYAWYLYEEGEAPDPYFVLESTWAPQAVQLPSLITAAQNIWHDTAGQVADHVYGNHFPLSGNGGGGADLPVGELPIEESAAPGAALWAKATGSWTDRSTEVVQEIPPAAPITIDTSFVQDTFSILAGADFQPMGGGDDGLRAGVFGGFVSSSLEFDTYGASADFSGGIVGAYAAYTMGGFYADAEVKADLLQVTYAAPISPGFETTGASTSIGILANTGYRMELGDTAFFEPIASLSFVSTEIEGFDAGGASVEFSNGNSLQGGIGARAGMTLGTPGDTTTEIAVLGKIWNEFEDANVVTITDGMGASTSFQDGISGVFGELSGSATMYSADKSFSAFGSAGVKFNDSFTTVDAKVGVRKGF